jgi:hypothetical protein
VATDRDGHAHWQPDSRFLKKASVAAEKVSRDWTLFLEEDASRRHMEIWNGIVVNDYIPQRNGDGVHNSKLDYNFDR